MPKSIKEILNKIKTARGILNTKAVFSILIIILITFSSFGLGRLSKLNEESTSIAIQKANLASISSSISIGGRLVASKNGTKYHAPWCS